MAGSTSGRTSSRHLSEVSASVPTHRVCLAGSRRFLVFQFGERLVIVASWPFFSFLFFSCAPFPANTKSFLGKSLFAPFCKVIAERSRKTQRLINQLRRARKSWNQRACTWLYQLRRRVLCLCTSRAHHVTRVRCNTQWQNNEQREQMREQFETR